MRFVYLYITCGAAECLNWGSDLSVDVYNSYNDVDDVMNISIVHWARSY